MPLYEYECTQCHRRTEKIQKFSDPELTVCPFCAGTLARTVTAPAIQFKGAGWYKDLYSSAKPAASGGQESTSASGSEGAGGAEKPKPDSSGTPAPAAAAPAPATSTGTGAGSTTSKP